MSAFLGQLGPYQVVSIREALAARKAAVTFSLNLGGKLYQAPLGYPRLDPAVDTRGPYAEQTGNGSHTAKQLDDF